MRKLFRRRPSTGAVIGLIALCVALGGGAYAATSKKIEYKGLSKDARLKALPVSATNAGTNCDPTSSSDYKICTSVSLKTSSAWVPIDPVDPSISTRFMAPQSRRRSKPAVKRAARVHERGTGGPQASRCNPSQALA